MNQRFIIVYTGIYYKKSANGVSGDKIFTNIFADYFPNKEKAEKWANINASNYFESAISWKQKIIECYPDTFDRSAKKIILPVVELEMFLTEFNYMLNPSYIEKFFPNGFVSNGDRLTKISEYLLAAFKKEFAIKPSCVQEYEHVFWRRILNKFITVLRNLDSDKNATSANLTL